MGTPENQDTTANGSAEGEKPETGPRRGGGRGRKFPKRFLVALFLIAVFVVAAFFYLTSEHFFRHFVVPALEKRTGRQIAFDRLKIRLFHGAEIEGLKIGGLSDEEPPLLESRRIAAKWYFGPLLHRRIYLKSLVAESLDVSIVGRDFSNGNSSNPSAGSSRKARASSKNPGTGEPPWLIENLKVTNSSVQWLGEPEEKGGSPPRYAVRDLEIVGSQIGLGRPTKLDLKGRVEADDPAADVELSDGAVALAVSPIVDRRSGTVAVNGSWTIGALRGRYHGVKADDLVASGSFAVDYPGRNTVEIRKLDALVSYRGRPGAELAFTGEVNTETGDARVRLFVRRLNSVFLNLLSTPDHPLDFRDTTLRGRLAVETKGRGKQIALESDLRLVDFSVLEPKISREPTPLTQMTVRCKAAYDSSTGKVSLSQLDIRASQEGREVISADLSRPVSFSISSGKGAVADNSAEINLKVDRLALGQFNPFFDPKVLRIEDGRLSVESALVVDSRGGAVSARGKIALENLRVLASGKDFGRTDLDSTYDFALNKTDFSIRAFEGKVRKDGRAAGRFGARGELALASRSGQITLSGNAIDLSALQVFLVYLPGVKIHRGFVDLDQKIAFAGWEKPVSIEGNLKLTGFSFDLPSNEKAKFAGWNINASDRLRYDPQARKLEIAKSSLDIATPRGRLALGAGGWVNLEKRSLYLDCDLGNLDALFLASLAEKLAGGETAAGPRLEAGTFSGKFNVALAGGFSDLRAGGSLRTAGLRWVMARKQPEAKGRGDLDARFDIALLENRKRLEINDLKVRLGTPAGTAGSVRLRGRLDLDRREGDLTADFDRFNVAPLIALVAPLAPSLPVESGVISGQQKIRFFARKQYLSAQGKIVADAVKIRTAAEGEAAIPPLRFDIAQDLVLTADKTDVRSLVLASYLEGKPLDRIEISARGGGLKSRRPAAATLNAPSLHLDYYLALLDALKGRPEAEAAKRRSGRRGPSAKGPKGRERAAGFAIPGPPVRLSLSVGKLRSERISADNVVGDIGVTSQGVTVNALEARLFDGAASATGWLRTDLAPAAYRARVSGTGLEMVQLLSAIKPRLGKKLSGKGEVEVDFSGRGFDKASLRRTLRGSGSFLIRKGEFKDVPILDALAEVTQIRELADIRFFQFVGNWQIENGVVNIPEAMIVGRTEKLRARGKVDFDTNVDLRFDLWVGGELRDRLRNKKIFRYLVTENNLFLRLPVPIGVGGTLAKPRPSFKLPAQAIIDIGIDQGLNLFDKYLQRKLKKR